MHYLQTALIKAINAGNFEHITKLVKIILEDPELKHLMTSKDTQGRTLLQDTVEAEGKFSDHKMTDFILNLSDDDTLLNVDSKGQTLIHLAVNNGDIKLLNKVIEASKRRNICENFINRVDAYGYTALHNAFRSNADEEIFEILAANHADMDICDNEGKKPYHLNIRCVEYATKFKKVQSAQPFQYQLLEKDRELLRELIKEFSQYADVLLEKSKGTDLSQFIIPGAVALGWTANILKNFLTGNIGTAGTQLLVGGLGACLYLIYYMEMGNIKTIPASDNKHLVEKLNQSPFLNTVVTDLHLKAKTFLLSRDHFYLKKDLTTCYAPPLLCRMEEDLREVRKILSISGKPFTLFQPPKPEKAADTPAIQLARLGT